ncbi:MAG: hypothetical protein M3R38_11745 [Actinomycetota bacterium]|nr:hypothetical protein [Actinomycetota bacterium]
MAKLEKHLRKALLAYMSGVKEDNRDPDTGVLDTRGMVTEALELWHQDDPDGWSEFMKEAAIYVGTAEFEKDAQGKRSRADKQLHDMAAGLDEEDFEPGSVDLWNMPAPGELNLEYHVPVESAGMLPERLGDMTVPQVFALADYHEKREASARKWKNYFRRVGYVALFWKKRKALADDATLWDIFERDAL